MSNVVLAIDQSTKSSGWGIGFKAGSEYRVAESTVAKTAVDISYAIERAKAVAQARDEPLIAVLEDHRNFRFGRGNMSVKSAQGMGAARGRWEFALELAGVKDIRLVSPQRWRSRVLGLGGNVKGEVAKMHARNWAHALMGRPCGDDESEALAMLMLALREPEALESKTKKRALGARGKAKAK